MSRLQTALNVWSPSFFPARDALQCGCVWSNQRLHPGGVWSSLWTPRPGTHRCATAWIPTISHCNASAGMFLVTPKIRWWDKIKNKILEHAEKHCHKTILRGLWSSRVFPPTREDWWPGRTKNPTGSLWTGLTPRSTIRCNIPSMLALFSILQQAFSSLYHRSLQCFSGWANN